MVTLIIRHEGEDNVIKLTYENMWRELKDIPDAKLLVSPSWFDVLKEVKTPFVCFVEADCLVSSGYFSSMIGLIHKNGRERSTAIMSSSTAVSVWANRFFGYDLDNKMVKGLIPHREKESSAPYEVEVAYIPGALIRMTTLLKLFEENNRVASWENDLVQLSANLSLNVWSRGLSTSEGHLRRPSAGNRVFINPNATYVTTEAYVNDISKFEPEVVDMDALLKMFRQRSI